MNVLVANSDEFVCKMISAVVRSAGLDPIVVGTGADAWSALTTDPSLRIGILDANLPGIDGRELSRRVREQLDDDYRYLVLLTNGPRHDDALEALSDGADGVLTSPLSADDLQAQLAAGVRLLTWAAPAGRSVMSALREAMSSSGGEIVVRAAGHVGRIFFHAGRVVWVQAPGRTFTPATLLGDDASAERLREILEACRASGTPFDEALVSAGLVRGEVLRERLRDWLAAGLSQLLAEPLPDVLFLPSARKFAGQRSFTVEDLLPPGTELSAGPVSVRAPLSARPVSRRFPSAPAEAVGTACPKQHLPCVGCAADASSTLDAVAKLDGVVGAALVNVQSGKPIATIKAPPNYDVIRAGLRGANALQETDDAVEDVVMATRKSFHMLRLTPCRLGVLCVVAERPLAMLGLLRIEVGAIADKVKPASDPR